MLKPITTNKYTESLDGLFQRKGGMPRELLPVVENLKQIARAQEPLIDECCKKTYPIIHESMVGLLIEFINHKRAMGSNVEKELYKNMTPAQLIDRLISKRPLAFLNSCDTTLLHPGHEIEGKQSIRSGTEYFNSVGTDQEKRPVCLENYLSRDERILSAMLGIANDTLFINNGNRYNCGVPADDPNTFIPRGIYIGQVGARFEQRDNNESRTMLVSPYCTKENGYGVDADPNNPNTAFLGLLAKFYGVPYFPTFDEVQALQRDNPAEFAARFVKVYDRYLNLNIYRIHMRRIIETALAEANARGMQAEKHVYFHAVGLGTGVWAIDPERQEQIIIEEYSAALATGHYSQISHIDFSYFKDQAYNESNITNTLKDKGVTPILSSRNPADPLPPGLSDKSVVAQYAWDSNAFPGNEYWLGSLAASGDPAAACCALLPLTQTTEGNPHLTGNNTRVAMVDGRLVSLETSSNSTSKTPYENEANEEGPAPQEYDVDESKPPVMEQVLDSASATTNEGKITIQPLSSEYHLPDEPTGVRPAIGMYSYLLLPRSEKPYSPEEQKAIKDNAVYVKFSAENGLVLSFRNPCDTPVFYLVLRQLSDFKSLDDMHRTHEIPGDGGGTFAGTVQIKDLNEVYRYIREILGRSINYVIDLCGVTKVDVNLLVPPVEIIKYHICQWAYAWRSSGKENFFTSGRERQAQAIFQAIDNINISQIPGELTNKRDILSFLLATNDNALQKAIDATGIAKVGQLLSPAQILKTYQLELQQPAEEQPSESCSP